jgi:hypothetical protein
VCSSDLKDSYIPHVYGTRIRPTLLEHLRNIQPRLTDDDKKIEVRCSKLIARRSSEEDRVRVGNRFRQPSSYDTSVAPARAR